MTLSRLAGHLRFTTALLAFAGLAVLASSCASGSGEGSSPEGVARRAVQAQIDGDEAAYVELARPDEREYADTDDLGGCNLSRAEVLVEQESGSEASVMVVFDQPCGAVEYSDYRFTDCRIDVVKLSDQWYVENDQCHID